MSRPHSHQHLTDQSSAGRLGHEHASLRQSLEDLRRCVESPKPGQLVERMAEFYDALQQHFADEEDGGCFDEAVARAPLLARRVADLMLEHPTLLEELADLCHDARRGADRSLVTRRLESFARHWLAHESAENQLLQEAYDQDLGGN